MPQGRDAAIESSHRDRGHRLAGLLLVGALILSGCGTAGPAATQVPSSAPTAAATAAPSAAAALSGAWQGALSDPNGTYPVRLVLDGCVETGSPCGELEYLDAGDPDAVWCASELTLTARDGEQYSFSERYVYRGWLCFPTTFEITLGADGNLAVEQFGEPGVVCCTGTLTLDADSAPPAPELPALAAGAGRVTSVTALGGATTQYAAVGGGALWFPLEDLGAVARVDPATGTVVALVSVGDPGALEGLKSDPHGVAAGEAGIWVARAAARSVGRIDPATNALAESIELSVIPYALALDGTTLWATSFEDDRVIHVDLESGKVLADIAVSKPTGIAVGLGGVWVVRHRDDTLVRIDPATNEIAAEIRLGDGGPSDVCGMCVENVIVADGAVWTANNEGRSVSRIDPSTNTVAATIALAMRPWSVTAGGGAIWASQLAGASDGSFVDVATWGVARIDPATNTPATLGFPGALGAFWAEDALWVISPWRRGDVVIRFEPGTP